MKSFLRTTALLSVIVFFMQSCSTSYEANRFSHLKYVKKDKASELDQNAEIPGQDLDRISSATAEAEKIPSIEEATLLSAISQQAKKLQFFRPNDGTERSPEHTIDGSEKQPLRKGFGQNLLSESKELRKALTPPAADDLIYDQDKLLLLWLILTGAAIVFGLLTAVAWPFGILATIAAIAAIVFFILWIVNIARS